MKKKSFILLAFAFIFVCGLSSCSTLAEDQLLANKSGVETETSEMLRNAANDVLVTRETGMTAEAFTVAFERKVPGLKVKLGSFNKEDMTLTYEGRTYAMHCTWTWFELPQSSATPLANRGNPKNIVLIQSAERCTDITK